MALAPLNKLNVGNLTTYYHFVNKQICFFSEFPGNFIIGPCVSEYNSSNQKCLRKYNTVTKTNYFFRPLHRFSHSPVNFTMVSSKPEMKSIQKAGDGNRTHMTSLEGWSFTIKLHPRVAGPPNAICRVWEPQAL